MNFGFIGTIIIAFILFILFVFYMAGLAGIVDQPDETHKNIKLIIGIFIPIYPILWLIHDIYKQGKALKT